MSRLLVLCALALCVSLAAAEVYFEEKFNDGEAWRLGPGTSRRRLRVVAALPGPSALGCLRLAITLRSAELQLPSASLR